MYIGRVHAFVIVRASVRACVRARARVRALACVRAGVRACGRAGGRVLCARAYRCVCTSERVRAGGKYIAHVSFPPPDISIVNPFPSLVAPSLLRCRCGGQHLC